LLTKKIVISLNQHLKIEIYMQKLTNKEEEIMHILWKLKKAFVKEVQAEIIEDTPHYNTLSTIIRNLEDKGYVGHTAFGNTHQYFPIIALEDYRKTFMKTAIANYFGNSYKQLVSHFAEEEKISADELREILALIEKKS
jgi:BlaI family penicillinase repressor